MLKSLAVGLLVGLGAAYAQTDTSTSVSYFDAKSGLAAGDDINQYANLKQHPLYPYLAADFFLKQLYRDSEITALFEQYYDAPPIKKLHNRWILQQYQQGNDAAIIQHYFDTGDQEANCAYRSAQLRQGNRQAALKNIDWLWLSPRSVSSICDPVFAAWPKANDPAYRLKRAR
ncbi:MAG: hypothetical protein CR977_03115, partial [Gammaproteobacteria bacterium]